MSGTEFYCNLLALDLPGTSHPETYKSSLARRANFLNVPMANARLITMAADEIALDQFYPLVQFVLLSKFLSGNSTRAAATHALKGKHVMCFKIFNAKVVSGS